MTAPLPDRLRAAAEDRPEVADLLREAADALHDALHLEPPYHCECPSCEQRRTDRWLNRAWGSARRGPTEHIDP